MPFGDLSRINTNVQAMGSLRTLQDTNNMLGMRQMRLSTGSRINRAEDDTAGYGIAKKLQAKVRGQAQALANIGDAKSMLTVAEGGQCLRSVPGSPIPELSDFPSLRLSDSPLRVLIFSRTILRKYRTPE